MKTTKKDSARIVEHALSFEPPDRIAVFDGICSKEFFDKWRTLRKMNVDDIYDHFVNDLNVYKANETFFPTRMREIKKEGEYIYYNDGWGRIVRGKQGFGVYETVDRILKKPGDLDEIEFENPELDIRYERFTERAESDHHRGKAVFVKIGGLFIRSTFFRGISEFLMDMAGDEEFARAVIDKVGRHLFQIGIESMKRADCYDGGVWIYDDMCSLNGPMFSPATFESIFLPVYKRMVAEFKAAGARRVILHCDGNLEPLLEMIIEAGFDGINPVERAAGLKVEELIEKYCGKLSFIGGVCNSHILTGGSAEQICRHIEGIIDAGRNGGLIIGTHSISPDIPVESYELYRDIVAEKGSYKS